MDFFTYYRNIDNRIDKRIFRKHILLICEVESATFYTWLNRERVPALSRSVIAKFMKKDKKVLFAKQEKELLRGVNDIVL